MAEYIEREAFIREINDRIKHAIEWGKTDNEETRTRAEQAIATFCEASLTAKRIPSADVKPVVHGEWKDYPICDDCYQCSNCGVLSMGKYYFCSSCGADMRGVDDG